MPINENFILKHVGKEYMIIPLMDGGVDFSKVYNISSTAAYIYELLQKGVSLEEIARKLTEEYEVSYEEAYQDTKDFIDELSKRGMYYD